MIQRNSISLTLWVPQFFWRRNPLSIRRTPFGRPNARASGSVASRERLGLRMFFYSIAVVSVFLRNVSDRRLSSWQVSN